jgi:hypothetical protein
VNILKYFVLVFLCCSMCIQASDVIFEWDHRNTDSVIAIDIFHGDRLLGTITPKQKLSIDVPREWHGCESSFFLKPDLEGLGKVGSVEFYAALSQARYRPLIQMNPARNTLHFSVDALEAGQRIVYGTQKVMLVPPKRKQGRDIKRKKKIYVPKKMEKKQKRQ